MVLLKRFYSRVDLFKGSPFSNGFALRDLAFRVTLFCGDSTFEVLHFRGI